MFFSGGVSAPQLHTVSFLRLFYSRGERRLLVASPSTLSHPFVARLLRLVVLRFTPILLGWRCLGVWIRVTPPQPVLTQWSAVFLAYDDGGCQGCVCARLAVDRRVVVPRENFLRAFPGSFADGRSSGARTSIGSNCSAGVRVLGVWSRLVLPKPGEQKLVWVPGAG